MSKKSVYIITTLIFFNAVFFGLASNLSKKNATSIDVETTLVETEIVKSGWKLLNWSNMLLYYFTQKK